MVILTYYIWKVKPIKIKKRGKNRQFISLFL
jgi:hypothetical protein